MFIFWRFALIFFSTGEVFSQGLSLDSLVQMGVRNNPDLLVSEEEYEGVANDTLLSTIPPNPYLEVDAGYNLANPDRPKAGAKISRDFQANVRNRQYRVSKANLDAKRQWQQTRKLETQLEIRAAFFSWQVLNRKAALQREVQKRWEGLSRIATAKVKEGRLSQVDEAQARLNLAKARQKESQLRTELKSIERRLAYLSGLSSLPDTLATLPMDASPGVPSLDSLVALAMKESPELKALDKEMLAQRQQNDLEKALGHPAFTLSVGYEREIEGDNVLGGGIAFPLPLFNRNQVGKAKARSAVKLAERRRRNAELRLISEIAEIHGRLTDLTGRYRTYREEISALSLKQLDLSEKGFLQGQLGIFDLSRIQEEFVSQEGDALDILDEYYRQWNRLGKAVGGKIW